MGLPRASGRGACPRTGRQWSSRVARRALLPELDLGEELQQRAVKVLLEVRVALAARAARVVHELQVQHSPLG